MSNVKQALYWAIQEERWHQQYLMIEKLCDQLEQRIYELEQAIRKADEYTMPLECRTLLRAALGGTDER